MAKKEKFSWGGMTAGIMAKSPDAKKSIIKKIKTKKADKNAEINRQGKPTMTPQAVAKFKKRSGSK